MALRCQCGQSLGPASLPAHTRPIPFVLTKRLTYWPARLRCRTTQFAHRAQGRCGRFLALVDRQGRFALPRHAPHQTLRGCVHLRNRSCGWCQKAKCATRPCVPGPHLRGRPLLWRMLRLVFGWPHRLQGNVALHLAPNFVLPMSIRWCRCARRSQGWEYQH